ncbi:hypothetical protein B566_EDAN013501 [Ephemera danica]|nr:hypothetical protein B566_EDAN013501 [Ephemera danica]
MPEDLQTTVSKFQHLLKKFLEEDHQVVDDTCLEKLLTHLSNADAGNKLLQLQESRTFCEKSLQAYEKGVISESLLSFGLRMHGHLIGNEVFFTSQELRESTGRIISSPRFLVTGNASIQCSFVQMASALLSHQSGVDCLTELDAWGKIHSMYEKNHSIYVSKECQNFLSEFIFKLDLEKESTLSLLELCLQSLSTSTKLNFNLAIDLVTKMLQAAFLSDSKQVPQILAERLEKECNELLSSHQDTEKLVKVARVLALLAFAMRSAEDLPLLETKILDIVSRLIDAKNISAVQMTLLQCQSYWSTLKPKLKHLVINSPLDHQLVYIQVMQLLQKDFAEIRKDCARNFLEKLCAQSTEATKHQGCRLRKLVLSSGDPQLHACRGIHSLMQMKEFMSRETSTFVFRTLMCILVQFIEASSEEFSKYQATGFMSTTLESTMRLIDHFHFTWRDSIETTCLLTFMQELLCEPVIAPRQVSQVLQVMRRSIEGFMPPNLALLINTIQDTQLSNLGPQLFRCLHNTTWEVRDSALEVLSVMAQIADTKFPAFQEHLLQHKLCPLAVSMAVGDEECYVRVSALNCLHRMVAVASFWEKCLVDERLPALMTSILYQESEGLVRREAAAVVSSMLQCKRFSVEERERMNLVMAHAAVSDLHWEVKTNALDYWQSSIDHQMSEEGMLDGKFPSVTFSGPQRKIVTLDLKEVQSRLHRILTELARTSCLAVLLSAMHDPDLQVARKAAEILSSLQTLLREHSLLNMEHVTATEAAAPHQNGTEAHSEQVIDGIVGQSDLALLASVCKAQLSLGDVTCERQRVAVISAEDFLAALATTDVSRVIGERAEWLEQCSEHLDSLLTDMLDNMKANK